MSVVFWGGSMKDFTQNIRPLFEVIKMKKVSWIWLLIVSIVFVNVSVWLHFIYYEKKYEKIVEEKTARYKANSGLSSTMWIELESENYTLRKQIKLLQKEIKGLEFAKLKFPPEPKVEK